MSDPTPAPSIPDYELLRRIGSGSYGEVWLARGVTGVYRAVKVVTRAKFVDERPFLRELDGISRFQQLALGHPRQLALLHVGRSPQGDAFHYVMELADDAESGTEIDPARYVPLTLKEVRRQRGSVPADECLRLAIGLTEALMGLHELGLVHRDVKPSNIILVNGVPKLADVGLVTSAENLLTSVGTPGYLPPEGAGTVRADIYSLGRVIYELLTGLDAGEFPRLPPDEVNRPGAGTFFELNEVVLRASDTNPESRYPSASAMLEDLRLVLAGRSLRELGALRQRLARLGRWAAWAAGVATLVIVVLGLKSYLTTRKLYAGEVRQRAAAEERAAVARYAADLQLAQMSLAGGSLGAATDALHRQVPAPGGLDRRGFEWYALANEARDDAVGVLGAAGGAPFVQLALNQDATRLAALRHTGAAVGEIEFWRGEPWKLDARVTPAFDLGRFIPGADRLTASRYDMRLFTVPPDHPEAPELLGGTNQLVAASSDGRTVLIVRKGDRPQFRLWDVIADREVAHWDSGPETAGRILGGAAIDATGRVIAVAFFWTEGALYHRELIVWDAVRAAVRFRTRDVARVWALRFAPDGQSLAVGMAGEPIAVLDARTGAPRLRLRGHDGRVQTLDVSPDSRWLASGGSDQTLRIWDLSAGSEVQFLQGHRAAVRDVAWYPDATRLASASDDGTVRLWDRRHHSLAPQIDGLWNDTLGGFLVSSNHAEILVTDRAGVMALYNGESLKRVREFPGAFQPLAWGADAGQILALGTDLDLRRVDVASGTSTPAGLKLASDQRVKAFATSGSGRWAAFSEEQGRITFWNLAEARSLGMVTNHTGSTLALAFAPDDSFAVSGDHSGRVWRWRLPSLDGAELAACPVAVHSAAVSPDRAWLTLGLEDGSVRVRDLRHPEQPELILSAHSREVSQLLFDSAGKRLVSAGYDGVLVFWTVPGFERLVALPFADTARAGGDHGLLPVRFSPDEGILGVYAADGRLRLWRAH